MNYYYSTRAIHYERDKMVRLNGLESDAENKSEDRCCNATDRMESREENYRFRSSDREQVLA